MLVFSLIAIFLTGFYAYLMLMYRYYWRKIPLWSIPKEFIPQTKLTVIIPARNEEDNIQKCLDSVCNQDYPINLYEVILINDHSDDDTLSIAQSLNYPNLSILNLADCNLDPNLQSFKKKGIELAIHRAKGELIVTTDADCVVGKNWLNFLASFYQNKGCRFIAAPVNFYEEKNTLERFQSLDFVGMMGITGAGIEGDFMRMCNGANLAYERDVFFAVDGFKGIDGVASGDDMLLMQKVAKKFPNSIGYLKNAEAKTETLAQPSLKRFLSQRIRWASKSAVYPEWKVTFMLAMVFFFTWSIIISFFLIPFLGWSVLYLFVFQLAVKSVIDYLFLSEMALFFYRKDLMNTFWSAQLCHVLYIAVVGVMANVKKRYEWKGRVVK